MIMSDEFRVSALLSLDNDLKTLVTDNKVGIMDAVSLQMLRLMRGRPVQIQLDPPATASQGWSPDGVKWYPSEPGTFTEGTGGVIPTDDL